MIPVQQQPFPLAEGSMTPKWLMCSSFLGLNLKAYRTILQIPVAKLSCPLFRAPCFPEVIPCSCMSPWLSLASKQLSGCISPSVRAKEQSCHNAWSR